MASKKTTKRCLQMINTAYPDFALDEKGLDLWTLLLADIPDAALEAGTPPGSATCA